MIRHLNSRHRHEQALHCLKPSITVLVMLFLTACNVGRSYTPPHVPVLAPDVFQESKVGIFKEAEPVRDWWATLEDKKLTSLVEKALLHNLDVKTAVATMEAAREVQGGAELNYFPSVTFDASGGRTKETIARIFQNPKRVAQIYQIGFDATWEGDFFGRLAAREEADTALYEASIANLQGVYVTVAAEVARNYVELRGSQQRLEIAKEQAADQDKLYALAQTLEESGRSNGIDVSRVLAQRSETLALVPVLEAQINASMNRLAVLTGQTPDALRADLKTVTPLPSIPASVAVGDAGSLLKRRPDVRAAERNLAASVAEYNFQVADLYPRISFIGNIGYNATSIPMLLTQEAFNYVAQPTLTWSAFDRQRVLARIDAADARTRGQLAQFDKTVLTALEEVDTTMVNFSRQQKNRSQIATSAAANAKAYDIGQKRYAEGLDSLPDLLNNKNVFLTARDRLTTSETQVLLNLIAVYKALGGGWETVPTLAADKKETTSTAPTTSNGATP